MNKSLYSAVVAVLGILTVMLLSKAVSIGRDTAMMKLQVASKQAVQKQTPKGSADLAPYEMVTAREAIEGVAWHYHLPVTVELHKSDFKVAAVKSEEPADKDAAKATAATGDYPVLKDFDALMGFFSAMSTLPYMVEVKDLCVGKECPDGFQMEMQVKRNS